MARNAPESYAKGVATRRRALDERCTHGHKRTRWNTETLPNGSRTCLDCAAIRRRDMRMLGLEQDHRPSRRSA